MPPSPADLEAVAGSNFGNKEQITATEFGTPQIASDPARADFNSEGKIIDKASLVANQILTSKSIKIIGKPSQSLNKTLYVEASAAGSFVIQVLLDESERDNLGQAVWRNYSASAINVAPGSLTHVTISDLFRQMRIIYTNGGAPAVVSAWVFSVA